MATEYKNENYYTDLGSSFIDTHISQKIALEYFLANLLFKGDLSRVIYSKDDIMFRKRIELLDKKSGVSEEEMANLSGVSLNLPYAAYSVASDAEPDDRVASMNASPTVKGQYDTITNSYLKNMAIKTKYKITVLCGRRDDARAIAQLLNWEQNPKSPVRLYNTVSWRKAKLFIPTYLNIDSINSNTDYKETDWLEKSRIFPIEVEVTIRSFQILIDGIKRIYNLPISAPFRWQRYDDAYDPDDEIYYVEDVVLTWANLKFNLNSNIEEDYDVYKDFNNFIEEKKNEYHDDLISDLAQKYFGNEPYTDNDVIEIKNLIPNQVTSNIIKGYFNAETSVDLNYFKINEAKSTSTSLWIDYKIKPADYQYFSSLTFHIHGHDDVIVTDCKQRSIEITELYPNSEYHIVMTISSQTDEISIFELTGITENSEDNQAPTVEKINKSGNSLIGLSW